MSPVIFENAYCIPRANLFNRSCSHNSRKSVMRWKKLDTMRSLYFFSMEKLNAILLPGTQILLSKSQETTLISQSFVQ